MDVFTVLPVICFGYQCHVNVVPIYACLKVKTLTEIIKSISISIIIVFCAYTISAIYGYLTFGSAVDDDVLKSYDAKDGSVLVAIVMYLMKTYTSYPLNLFCARYFKILFKKFSQKDKIFLELQSRVYGLKYFV
jgi:solute carrier family 38 (sodium-coupled neutral amino acid transporter), member 7/8